MRSKKLLVTVLGGLSMVVACGSDLPDVDCGVGEIPTYDEVSIFDKCTMCHSSELSGSARRGAPGGYDFDSYESAADRAEDAASQVFEGEMPPEGSGVSVSGDEKEALYRWALCGTPES